MCRQSLVMFIIITVFMYFILKGKSAIHEAVANGNVEIIDLLIRNKADVNATKYDVSVWNRDTREAIIVL